MIKTQLDHQCQCECGDTQFTVNRRPVLRAICHCEICQAFNNAPFADISVFFTKDVTLPEDGKVHYQTYRPPPAVQRGKCSSCNTPAIELLTMPLMPELCIVPSNNICDANLLPEVSLHVFYNRRVADIEDGVSKYNGYFRSQLAFGSHFVSSLMRQKRNS